MKTWQKLKEGDKKWQPYFIREEIIKAIRYFFYQYNFHEVETPLLVNKVIPESYLTLFETFLYNRQGKKQKMFLTSSPEVSLKKLIAAGIGDCFEITKSFRNCESQSKLHNPEFTILEWYRVGKTYFDIMQDCQNLFLYIFKHLKKSKLIPDTDKLRYQQYSLNLNTPWEKITVADAFEKYTHVKFAETLASNNKNPYQSDKIQNIALKKGYKVSKFYTWEETFNLFFLNEVEPNLGTCGKPTIIYDYPLPLAALAKINKKRPLFAERFEIYLGRLEIGDCYTELTNWREQKKRFKDEMNKIEKNNNVKIVSDEDFINALKMGLPPCAGIAVGIDRLVMLFTNCDNIADTLLFPLDELVYNT